MKHMVNLTTVTGSCIRITPESFDLIETRKPPQTGGPTRVFTSDECYYDVAETPEEIDAEIERVLRERAEIAGAPLLYGLAASSSQH